MPKLGSENQIDPSDLTMTSLGEFNRLPSKESANTVIDPSYSVRVTLRLKCSQLTKRPWRSRVLPFAHCEGWRKMLQRPEASSQRSMRLLGISDQIKLPKSPNQTGPSAHRIPLTRRSTDAAFTRSFA